MILLSLHLLTVLYELPPNAVDLWAPLETGVRKGTHEVKMALHFRDRSELLGLFER